MNGKEVRSWLTQELASIVSVAEARAMLQTWLEKRLGWSNTDWLLKSDEEVSESNCNQLKLDLAALKEGRPLQYVLGEAWFAGKRFLVDENVLIPRPETEELLAWMLEDWPNQAPFRVIDLGCGSGILPICLKQARPDWEVVGVDISAAALDLARKNAILHHVEVIWQELDMLRSPLPGQFDLIVSNPPYITASEAPMMTQQVVDFEPHLALFVPDEDALLFYKRIAEFSIDQEHLKAIYAELNQNKALETNALFGNIPSKSVIRKDLNGHDRMLRVTYAEG